MTDPDKLTAERDKDYGHPLDDFTTVQRMYEVWQEHRREGGCPPDSDYDMALNHVVYMICVKLARLAYSPDHLDSIHDIAGYAKTLEMCLSRVRGTQPTEDDDPHDLKGAAFAPVNQQLAKLCYEEEYKNFEQRMREDRHAEGEARRKLGNPFIGGSLPSPPPMVKTEYPTEGVKLDGLSPEEFFKREEAERLAKHERMIALSLAQSAAARLCNNSGTPFPENGSLKLEFLCGKVVGFQTEYPDPRKLH
jgi:hypothetical protein